jgi:hypothetical protein
MASPEDDQPIGRQLFDLGWRQGALVDPAPSEVAFLSHAQGPGGQVEVNQRRVRQVDRLIIASQDCDIVARPDDEPCIETFICVRENARRTSRIAFNSRRYFVLDHGSGLVARAAYRVYVRKELAATFSPPVAWAYGERHFRRFVRWLGDRYTRPPLPDEMVMAIQRPIDGVLARVESENPERADLLSKVIPEVRVTIPATDVAPFSLSVIVMLEAVEALAPAESDELAGALDELEDALHRALDSPGVSLTGVRFMTEEDMSVAEFRRTAPVYHESLTYRGEESSEAEPIQGL